MTVSWWCTSGDHPIRLHIEGDPHTDPDTGDDVCDQHCTWCNDPQAITALVPGSRTDLGIHGHPGPTQNQAARAETAVTQARTERGAA